MKLQNMIFMLMIFSHKLRQKVRNKSSYSLLFLKACAKKSCRLKYRMLKHLGYMYKKSIFIVLIISLIVLCYHYIDRPCVYFLFAHQSRDWLLLAFIADYIPIAIVVFVVLFYIYVAFRLIKINLRPLENKFMMVCNSIVTAVFLKDVLKTIFGRYWANTFICNNLSLLNDNHYGFNWFNHGPEFTSFPSGHTTLSFAFSVSMILLFPKLRWLWILLAILVVLGQIGMYYHYVSDVIAGALLGSLVAQYTYRYTFKRWH